ncbi:hypothetical protein [Cyclobacterium plantarum]|uniref:hypothetical protein n=1 Tax=Cyclobacterium plantarum TaxID=2716263 RepID=UPI00293BF717|nr:hypothetical protein [Cyclobacterium plantarum]
MALGAWSSRFVKSSGAFMLAGKQLPLYLSASALFATWFGSETIFEFIPIPVPHHLTALAVSIMGMIIGSNLYPRPPDNILS